MNRVSAVRLKQIAKALGESVSYLQDDKMQALMTDQLNIRAGKALSALDNQTMRFQVVRLLESISGIHSID